MPGIQKGPPIQLVKADPGTAKCPSQGTCQSFQTLWLAFLSFLSLGRKRLYFPLKLLGGISRVFPLGISCRNNWASGVQEIYPAQPVRS